MLVACAAVAQLQAASAGPYTNVTQCSNGITCTNQIVVFAKQMANSIKIHVISAHAFINLVCGDSEAIMWYLLVRPVAN